MMDKDAAEKAFTPAALEALEAFPIEPAELRLVSLSENVTFRVADSGGGPPYVLRLHRPGYHSLDELNSERVWIRALGDAGIAVPTPLPTRDGREFVLVSVPNTGERRYAGVTRWTEGDILAERLGQTADVGLLERHFAELGRIMAAMHNQASAWHIPAGFRRHRLDAAGLMGDSPFWGPFWEHPALSSAEQRLLLETRDRLRGALDRYGTDSATFGLIHADMHPRNLLVSGDSLTVIDFDDAGFGWHQYDIAVALSNHQSNPHFQSIEQSLLRGYRASRELHDSARALIPMFLLIRSLAHVGWRYQRPELGRPFPPEEKDQLCARCGMFELPC